MKKDNLDVVTFFITKVVMGLVGLLMVSAYSSLISVEQYGEYSLLVGLVSAMVSVFIGWIGSSALRYYVDYESNKKNFFYNLLIYFIIMFIIIEIILFVVSIFSVRIPITKYYMPLFLYTLSYSLYEIFEKLMRAARKTKEYSILSIVQSVVNLVLFVIFAKFYNFGVNSILISYFISMVIFMLGCLKTLKIYNLPSITKNSIDMNLFKKFLSYGIPMIGVWGVSWILNYCDRYIIDFYHSSESVGIYDMSYKISEYSINLIISSFTLAIFPILITLWKKSGKKAVEDKLEETFKYYFMLIIPAVVGLSLISSNLYLGILDKQYISGKNVIIIVAIGMAFNGFNSILNKIWQLNEKTKNIFKIMIVSVIINVVLNILLIPLYGIEMAAVTTLISYLFTTIITYSLVRKEFTVKIDFLSLIKTILSTLCMAAFILFFNKYVNNLFIFLIELILCVIIYLLLSIFTKNFILRDFFKRSS